LFYKGGKMVAASPNTDLHGYGEEIRKELGRRIPRKRKLKVLDVGTGFGMNVAFLARRLSKDSVIWTVDPSREVLTDVKAALGSEGARRVKFVEASADDLDFDDGFFDFVVSVMVLHHIEKLQPALKEMARVLKPGGTLLVIDYLPKASHELEFLTLHEESDFFRPADVVKTIHKHGMGGRTSDFDMWYLVEAKKERPKAPPPGRAGRAKAQSGK
jgi:ubiquinone/menaquinone biosynthesis C-methylase UbiE